MWSIDFIEFFEIKRFSFSVISTQRSHDLFHDEKLANSEAANELAKTTSLDSQVYY